MNTLQYLESSLHTLVVAMLAYLGHAFRLSEIILILNSLLVSVLLYKWRTGVEWISADWMHEFNFGTV